MKRLMYAIVPAFLLVSITSCDKDETTTTPTNPTNPTTPSSPTPYTPNPSGNNLSGALISIKMKYTSQPTGSPMPVEVTTEMGVATFYGTPGSSTLADAGTVSVNNNKLDKQTNNSYSKLATIGMTPADLGFSGSSNWSVGGSGSVTAFTYDDTEAFPTYTGDLPASVTKANGITLTFNTSTVSGADSVYVLIGSGDKSFTKGYSAKAGSITITAAELQNLPAAANNTGVFEICPFKYREVVRNGRNYFAIKELAVVKNLNIN